MSYQVNAAENSRYMDESERRTVGVYDTLEDALSACRYIVDRSLQDLHDPGMQPSELLRLWGMMGEDAWVVPLKAHLPKPDFSGQDYARVRGEELCKSR